MHETATTKKSWNILLITNISKWNNRENRKKLNLTKQSGRKKGFPPFMKVVANSIYNINFRGLPVPDRLRTFCIFNWVLYYLLSLKMMGRTFFLYRKERAKFVLEICMRARQFNSYAIRQALRLTFCVTCCLGTVGVGKRYIGTSIDLLLIFRSNVVFMDHHDCV